MFSKLRKQQGLSLVELMVALVIGLFLSAGIFAMFSMSATNVTTTSQYGQLQENGRIALAILERDLSQLGFMGDITGTDFIVGSNTTTTTIPASGVDCDGAGANNATFPKATTPPAHFRKLWGYEQVEGSNPTNPLSCLANVKVNTDVIQLKRVIGPNVTAAPVGRFYLATTSNQAIFFVGGGALPALENARFWEYQHHVYFIVNNDSGVPELRRKTLAATGMSNDEQLVEGIENMRILYGFDSNGDDTADTYVPVNNVTNLMWDNELFQRLVSLQVYLLVRSIEQDKGYTNDVVYTLGDKVLPKFNDHYRRKVVSTTIVLENPVLIRN
ncbi:PilW family protein [Shewanella sp. JM162201]|uniref:PilW family protein n=1 Tax=Shewanella jiangmenensis TaxID=2837387 RepID=A0ABS5V172_9GAMM|nr:PilW family protein [Shewanella jiangmenensis]MBT1443516.1 PilW family protein [Shewanella jiangmenensis]